MAQTFISNYKIIYGINENDEHLKWIKTQKFGDYKIFKRICELATETLVVPSERWFDLEINPVEHDQLLRDITKCFITRFWKCRRVKKDGPEFLCEWYITLRVFKTFLWKK